MNEPKAVEMVAEIIAKLPDREIDGNLSPELEAKVWEHRLPQLSEEGKLAVEFDRLCFDYDTVLYNDCVRNMSENVEELSQEIKTEGDVDYEYSIYGRRKQFNQHFCK